MKDINIAISPCPNDTFIFDSFINDNKFYSIKVSFLDIQQLNEAALKGMFDLIKVSCALLPSLKKNYKLIKVGSAFSIDNGPLLVGKRKYSFSKIKNLKIASPGTYTTANLLFDYFFENHKKKTYKIFSEIENSILEDEVEAGIIIHESRFTYENKGLVKIVDLGEIWHKETGLPIPLGCIVIKNNFSYEQTLEIENILRTSLLKSKNRMPAISSFVKQHAQEMDEDIIKKHINLYVNNLTQELDSIGLRAINELNTIIKK